MKLKPKFFVKNISWIIPYIELKLLFVDFNNTSITVMYDIWTQIFCIHNANLAPGVIEVNK